MGSQGLLAGRGAKGQERASRGWRGVGRAFNRKRGLGGKGTERARKGLEVGKRGK
jgi:hypothetical protein